MAQLGELIAYVRGLNVERPFLIARLFGSRDRSVFYVNPQFYISDSPNPMHNYGIEKHAFDLDSAPTREEFHSQLTEDLRARLGRVFQRDGQGPIIPVESIKITIEHEED